MDPMTMERHLMALNLSLRELESLGKESLALSFLFYNLQPFATFQILRLSFHLVLLNFPTLIVAMMASLKSHLWKCPT